MYLRVKTLSKVVGQANLGTFLYTNKLVQNIVFTEEVKKYGNEPRTVFIYSNSW